MASYDDEIDLYGDAEVQQQQGSSNDNNNGNNGYKPTSSIPTFISEARGGTGKIPVRDEYQRSPDPSNNQARAGSQDRSGSHGLEGIIPKGGDYGAPGQWKTKPVSTVRPSDMPEEGQVDILQPLPLPPRTSLASVNVFYRCIIVNYTALSVDHLAVSSRLAYFTHDTEL